MGAAELLDIAEARRCWREYKAVERLRFRASTDQVRRELVAHEGILLGSVPVDYRDGRYAATFHRCKAGTAGMAPTAMSEPLYVAGFADGLLDSLGFEV